MHRLHLLTALGQVQPRFRQPLGPWRCGEQPQRSHLSYWPKPRFQLLPATAPRPSELLPTGTGSPSIPVAHPNWLRPSRLLPQQTGSPVNSEAPRYWLVAPSIRCPRLLAAPTSAVARQHWLAPYNLLPRTSGSPVYPVARTYWLNPGRRSQRWCSSCPPRPPAGRHASECRRRRAWGPAGRRPPARPATGRRTGSSGCAAGRPSC